jgi:hypothetical protein
VQAWILVADTFTAGNFSGCYSSALMAGVSKVEDLGFIGSTQVIFFPLDTPLGGLIFKGNHTVFLGNGKEIGLFRDCIGC